MSDSPHPPKVLVVDDDPASARAIAETVSSLGYRVESANGWTDALRVFSSDSIDLVLMDAIMPGVDGFKLTRILRSRSESYVPIVFLTGLSDAKAKEQGIACGADDFLAKPVDRLELKMRLTAMLRIRRLTQQLEAHGRELAAQARRDPLTGVANRRSMDESLPEALDRAVVTEQPLSVLMLDIDHFKRVNDEHGHAAGDEVLRFFGALLDELTRGADRAFRYGGEEFAVVAPETDGRQAVLLGERIRRSFEQRTGLEIGHGPYTVSIGVAASENFSTLVNSDELLAAADTALYQAKTNGRNRVVLARPRGAATLEDVAAVAANDARRADKPAA